jgi:ATP-dependent Zn protease
MREKILNKVDEVLNECYEKAKEVLVINRVLIDELAKVLMDKEEMNLEDFEEVVSEIGAII